MPNPAATAPDSRDLIGGHPALDLVNTLHWRLTDEPQETLSSYDDLLGWARLMNLLVDVEARALAGNAQKDPAGAEGALADTIELREILYRIFVGVAETETPDDATLERLKAHYAEAIAGARLDRSARALTWETGVDAQHRIIAPLAAAGMELFLSEEADLVKQCADRGCGWLFLDTSKNHSRRWCSMDICGSRAKMRRHYRRKKATPRT